MNCIKGVWSLGTVCPCFYPKIHWCCTRHLLHSVCWRQFKLFHSVAFFRIVPKVQGICVSKKFKAWFQVMLKVILYEMLDLLHISSYVTPEVNYAVCTKIRHNRSVMVVVQGPNCYGSPLHIHVPKLLFLWDINKKVTDRDEIASCNHKHSLWYYFIFFHIAL